MGISGQKERRTYSMTIRSDIAPKRAYVTYVCNVGGCGNKASGTKRLAAFSAAPRPPEVIQASLSTRGQAIR
jgi:hypothetical protein